MASRRRGDPEVRVGDRLVEGAELRLRVVLGARVLDGEQAVVDVLGEHAALARRVHEAARHVDLPHGAPRPRDHLGREHVPDAELLAEPDQERVHPGRVGVGQLGDVADPHQHLGPGVPRPDLHVPVERRREPEADRLDDRVDDVGAAQRLQMGDGPVQGVEILRRCPG